MFSVKMWVLSLHNVVIPSSLLSSGTRFGLLQWCWGARQSPIAAISVVRSKCTSLKVSATSTVITLALCTGQQTSCVLSRQAARPHFILLWPLLHPGMKVLKGSSRQPCKRQGDRDGNVYLTVQTETSLVIMAFCTDIHGAQKNKHYLINWFVIWSIK